MTNREKLIEEMAKDMGVAFQLAGTTRFGAVAEDLVGMRWVKLNKDSFLIKKKQYEILKSYNKEIEKIILESRKKESTLRYISSHILDNLNENEKNNILNLIKKHYLECANIIEKTRNYLINIKDEINDL